MTPTIYFNEILSRILHCWDPILKHDSLQTDSRWVVCASNKKYISYNSFNGKIEASNINVRCWRNFWGDWNSMYSSRSGPRQGRLSVGIRIPQVFIVLPRMERNITKVLAENSIFSRVDVKSGGDKTTSDLKMWDILSMSWGREHPLFRLSQAKIRFDTPGEKRSRVEVRHCNRYKIMWTWWKHWSFNSNDFIETYKCIRLLQWSKRYCLAN